MSIVVVEGVEQPNTVKWRVEVKRGRDGAADEWRLYLEGVERPARVESVVEFLATDGAPKDLDERVVRVVMNLFSRIKMGVDVVPFAERTPDGEWNWMRLIGDSR